MLRSVSLLLVVSLCRGEICPPACYCFPNLGPDSITLTLDCRGQELLEIPYPLPNSTSHLDVSNNEIQFIRIGDLQQLPHLTYLQLQNNDLMEIQPGAFRQVPNMERLVLYNNRIRLLRAGVFEGLGRLQSLIAYNIQLEGYEGGVFDELVRITEIDLSFNNLEVIPTQSFTGLQRLQRLSLSENYISNIEVMAVNNLPSLTYMNLGNNQLQSVTTRAFAELPNIRTLALQGNPLECGCDALWLSSFLSEHGLSGPMCEQPDSLAGRDLLSLREEEYCSLPMADILSPNDVVLSEGMTLQLECNASGAPLPEVIWSRDGATFDPQDSRVNMSGRTLVVTSVDEDDSGVYYCTATSSAGTVSTSTRLTVLDLSAENLTLTPALLGMSIELECSDALPVGVPVSWEFNRAPLLIPSDDYMVSVNGSLIVFDLMLEDEGLYSCVVDGLRLDRELEIFAVPTIIEFPEGPCDNPFRIVVNSSDITLLNCTVFGVPPPVVMWLFEEVEEVEVLPEMGLEGGTTVALLELVRPPEELAGNYTCRASNDVGVASRTVQVDVRVTLEVNVSRLVERQVLAGETVVLECNLEAVDDVIAVRWERMDGVDLAERTIITRDYSLIIPDVTVLDIACYQCIVETGSGNAELLYGVIVFEPPSIEKDCAVPVVVYDVGEEARLVCATVEGSPLPSVVWTREGVGVLMTGENRILLLDGDQVLLIDAVIIGDSGLYTCFAENEHGNDTYSIRLDVQRSPFFTYTPESVGITVGEEIILPCSGEGSPTPSVTWWRVDENGENMTEVIPDRRIIISDEYLVITEARVEDEGFYYCNISSPLDERMSDTIFISVWIRPFITPSLPNEFIVLEGSDVTLPCTGSGDPIPTIQWVNEAGDELIAEPGGSLVLRDVLPVDDGVYTCRVANAAGSDLHLVNLIVRGLPQAMVNPELVMANVGCQVTLVCSDGGRVPEEFEWSYDGEMLLSGENVFIRPNGELIITNVQVSDSGTYTCEIWGLAGRVSASSIVVVEDPLFSSTGVASPPTVTSLTPSLQEIPQGQTAQFVCTVDGFPEPTVQWLRNDEPVPNYRRVTIDGGSLTIEELRVTDTAPYTCFATSVLGNASVEFNLTVTVPPMFRVRPTPLQLTEFDDVVLECSAIGIPEPSILWLFNDAEVLPGGRVEIDNMTNRLTVQSTSVDDSGVYTCAASNDAGISQYGVLVVVEPLQFAPNITVPPQSLTAMAGSPIVLDCIAVGPPAPEITWLKDGVPIVTTCLTELLTETGCVRLDGPSVIIQSSEEWDSGRYTCIAENAVGKTVYEVFITITTAEVLPFFTVYPSSVWVSVGDRVSIDCQAGGSPAPNITWLIGFEPFNDTEDTFVLDNGTLVFPNIQSEDSGQYVCQASNVAGINQFIIFIDAINFTNVSAVSAPDLIKFPVAPITLDPGDTITLDCVADGNPTPTIVWLREGQQLNYSIYQNIYQESNGSLVLANVTELDAGNFTCLAANNLGTAEVHVMIAVSEGLVTGTGSPVFTKIPSGSHVALAGNRLQADCQAVGYPLPYIIWTFEGVVVCEIEGVIVAANGTMIISQVRPSHAGNYSCHALNVKGMVERHMMLKVKLREEPPYITVEPKSTKVVVGSYFILHCAAVDAMGPVETEWVMNGVHLRDLLTRYELLDGDSLLVMGVTLMDTGHYTCRARNRYGQVESTARITALRIALNATESILIGSFVRLECTIADVVTWTKNGNPVTESARLILFLGDIILFDISESDEGEYTCIAEGEIYNYFLEVLVPPVIVESSTIILVNLQDTASLHCVASGWPTPSVVWIRRGRHVFQDDHYSILYNGTLVVYNAMKEHTGAYMCQAENQAGLAKKHVLLDIADQ